VVGAAGALSAGLGVGAMVAGAGADDGPAVIGAKVISEPGNGVAHLTHTTALGWFSNPHCEQCMS